MPIAPDLALVTARSWSAQRPQQSSDPANKPELAGVRAHIEHNDADRDLRRLLSLHLDHRIRIQPTSGNSNVMVVRRRYFGS